MKAKSSSQMKSFSLPDVCKLRSRQQPQVFTFLNVIYFPSNCSKFAVECDPNCEISQKVHILGFFFQKIDGFFREKTNTSKSLKMANLQWNAYQLILFPKNFFPP